MEINTSEFDNLIPCELCNQLISFEDYQEHIQICNRELNFSGTLASNLPFFHNLLQHLHTNPFYNIQETSFQMNNPQGEEEASMGEEEASMGEEEASIGEEEASIGEEEASIGEEEYEDLNSNEQLQMLSSNIVNNLLMHLQSNENIQHFITNEPIEYTFMNPVYDSNQNLEENEDIYEELLNLEDTIGKVKIGLSQNVLDTFENTKKVEKCLICFKTKYEFKKTLCNHFYCEECSQKWFSENKKCAFCMTELEE